MNNQVQITFDLKPPRSADSSVIPTHQTYAFPLATASENALQSSGFYESLQSAISNAKERTGGDLTKYRDLAGDAEKAKGSAIKPASDDEEEEIED